ncbi:MFS transporter [Campylobacter fetus subsp. venerealis]|uniref:NTP/NDP exchange transporter n=1 Tax=Campylobacter fetus TaxID=196 RepID=UPI0018E782C6|nr:Npt1/Npt2 family nucleotide transporter [Campylobacter fetus]QQF52512.1 MFS transporter [Campylobacter fetus subsp. venerealis]
MNINQILSLKKGEGKFLLIAAFFIFSLFASYSLLRPIREALGISGGASELKWLFLGTFIATIIGSILAMILSGAIKRKLYTDFIYGFFALDLVGFFVLIRQIPQSSEAYLIVARSFYIWVSVFNIFVISTAWSLLADLFSKERSARLFGIISAGASLGGIVGAFFVSFLSKFIDVPSFIFISVTFLGVSLILKNLLIKEALSLEIPQTHVASIKERFERPIGSKNPFVGFFLIIKSHYLLALLGFILLLTSVSTFLYMEQARIISGMFESREARAAAFANIDFIVQLSSFLIQIFITSKIAEFFGVKWLLGVLGFVVALGFVLLAFYPTFGVLVLVMSIRRVGEYALVKPGREMLFVPLDSESKYKVKNFLDTVVYRAGDSMSAAIEGAIAKISISAVLFVGAFISFAWGILGVYLGKRYEKEDFKFKSKETK